MDQAAWLPQLVSALGGRAVRWAESPMDYDGRERTLEVFDADAHEQLALRTRLRPLLNELEVALGGSIVIIFHTRRETARLYSDITKNLNDAVFRGRMRRN